MIVTVASCSCNHDSVSCDRCDDYASQRRGESILINHLAKIGLLSVSRVCGQEALA